MLGNKEKTQKGIVCEWRQLEGRAEGETKADQRELQADKQSVSNCSVDCSLLRTKENNSLSGFYIHTSQGCFESLGLKLKLGNCILSRLPELWSILEKLYSREGSILCSICDSFSRQQRIPRQMAVLWQRHLLILFPWHLNLLEMSSPLKSMITH